MPQISRQIHRLRRPRMRQNRYLGPPLGPFPSRPCSDLGCIPPNLNRVLRVSRVSRVSRGCKTIRTFTRAGASLPVARTSLLDSLRLPSRLVALARLGLYTTLDADKRDRRRWRPPGRIGLVWVQKWGNLTEVQGTVVYVSRAGNRIEFS